MNWIKKLAPLSAAIATAGVSAAAWAQDAAAAAPVPDKGDTAWMLVSSALVLMMSVPGLALFYGGLVRTKNMVSILTQVFACVCMVAILWFAYGYSLAFTNGGDLNPYVGGLSKAFLAGVTTSSTAATFSNGVVLPEYVYVIFQMTFACITPALIIGAIAERIKFSAILVFLALWVTFVYFPIAHMVWYWAGPDALKANPTDYGLAWGWGALDFAGGTVVHINAGIAGFVGCLVAGKRIGFGKESMAPHNLTMTMIGASLLWVGWFGFNAGSNLESNGLTGLAFINTFLATAAAGFAWLVVEWIAKGHPSLLGACTGAVAGLVAITPACGFASPLTSILLGFVVTVVCFFFCTTVKSKFGYDDSLDVFGVHCVGGIIGALGTAIVADPALGGQGFLDYTQIPAVAGAYDMAAQLITQAKAVGLTLVWSGVLSFVFLKVIDLVIGLRVSEDKEREGLDVTEHGERAYNY